MEKKNCNCKTGRPSSIITKK
uniref:Uncharacterized protein n=1 Tax=Rhizophora mucronata TaxID=61149 RepID=A0A2P2R538_RHIMU